MAVGELSLLVHNPGTPVANGVQLTCYGPFVPPAHARALFKFLPVTDMAIVHHMILFGGVSTPSVLGSRPRSNSDMCYRGSIVYAWARTGQETPVGLDFDTSERAGDAYAVGPGTSIQWLAVQIHYQQFKSKVVLDSSGIRLWFRDVPPKNPLAVEIMLSAKLRIPPRVYFDECIACRATSGGRAVAYRNHAHRLARAIWSEHYDALGRRLPNFGNMSAQQPQIFRLFNTPVDIQAGHTFLLHCEYDARQEANPTFVGLDERTHEMCNQYMIATTGLRVRCLQETMVIDLAFSAQFHEVATSHSNGNGFFSSGGGGYGQVTAVTHDDKFDSTSKIVGPAIVHLDAETGQLRSEFGAHTFAVPHGLFMDHKGYLWATDVGTHFVFQLEPETGKIRLQLGSGKPGLGHGSFNQPTDVAVNRKTDEVYVSDGYGNSRVVVFNYHGQYLREWGSFGDQPGQFRIPHSLTIDSDGLVYVADRENARVQAPLHGRKARSKMDDTFVWKVFDTQGQFKAQWLSSTASIPSSRQPWLRHVSSISYDNQSYTLAPNVPHHCPLAFALPCTPVVPLDAFVVVEAGGFSIRTRSGCQIVSVESSMKWPHDAILMPAESSPSRRAGVNRTALSAVGREYVVFVAELDGHRVLRYQTGEEVQSKVSLYN